MRILTYILVVMVILCVFVLINKKCDYSTIAIISESHEISNISALSNDVYITLESKSKGVLGQSIYDSANSSISSICNVNNMSSEIAKISGGYFTNIASLGNALYGLAVMLDKQNKKTYSRIYQIKPKLKEITSFKGLVHGLVGGHNNTLYVWDRHSIYNINAINGNIAHEYNGLNIDTNNSMPKSDKNGNIHFISDGNYSVIQNSKIVTINKLANEALITALDDSRLYVLYRDYKTLKLISADTGEVLSKIEINGLPVLFYIKNKNIIIALSKNSMFSTDKVILTSSDLGKTWDKCTLSVASSMALTLDEHIIMRLSGKNEIIKIPAFRYSVLR